VFPSRSVTIPAVVTARVLAKRQVLENCLSVTVAVPFGMLGGAGSRRASRILGGSRRLRMQLAAAHDLAPASVAGECKQPLVHSMGLLRLIETFCLRLRGMRRAIILEGSQGPFRAGGKSTARWPSAGRG
jgi:hypothetical protein